MKYLQHLTAGFNVAPLVYAIKRQPDLWNTRDFRTTPANTPHRDVSDIWLRYNDWANLDPKNPRAFNAEHDSVWYPEYRRLPQAMPLLFRLMNMVNGERLGGVFITKIPPGKQCLPHIDGGWHVDYYDKFAIQLESAPGQSFNFEGENLVSAPGDVYWFDNRQTHWVINDSDVDRMTMLVAIRTDRYKGG